MSAPYPVHYSVESPPRFSRVQLVGRFVAFAALGALGTSFGAVFACFYLLLPAYAASRLATHADDPSRYTTEDAPRVAKLLRWCAALSAWTGLVAENLPGTAPEDTIQIEVRPRPAASPGTALLRIILGIPSALVLGVLCSFGVLVWLWAAITILVGERVGPHAFHYLVGLQRWSVRLLAYQGSLVDEYPPFSFSDSPVAVPATA